MNRAERRAQARADAKQKKAALKDAAVQYQRDMKHGGVNARNALSNPAYLAQHIAAEKRRREAWEKSFIRYPVDQHHKLMMLAQNGDEAIYVSGRVFKIGIEGDCFFDQSRMFHVWHGDKWAYCGPDERYAFAVYEQAVRKAAERAN